MAGREYIDWCYKEQTFVDFWICAEVAPHSGGHLGVGGKVSNPFKLPRRRLWLTKPPFQMADGIASPGDPIFYLHHTWLDKIFWEWQALDLPARLNDMGGYNGLDGPMPVLPTPEEIVAISGPPIIFPDPSSFPPAEAMVPPEGTTPPLPAGDAGNITTLAHILNMYGVIPDATIADVMDIGGALLCYEYV
jgi:tyrosinase